MRLGGCKLQLTQRRQYDRPYCSDMVYFLGVKISHLLTCSSCCRCAERAFEAASCCWSSATSPSRLNDTCCISCTSSSLSFLLSDSSIILANCIICKAVARPEFGALHFDGVCAEYFMCMVTATLLEDLPACCPTASRAMQCNCLLNFEQLLCVLQDCLLLCLLHCM